MSVGARPKSDRTLPPDLGIPNAIALFGFNAMLVNLRADIAQRALYRILRSELEVCCV